jgi:hypothetical protein
MLDARRGMFLAQDLVGPGNVGDADRARAFLNLRFPLKDACAR